MPIRIDSNDPIQTAYLRMMENGLKRLDSIKTSEDPDIALGRECPEFGNGGHEWLVFDFPQGIRYLRRFPVLHLP